MMAAALSSSAAVAKSTQLQSADVGLNISTATSDVLPPELQTTTVTTHQRASSMTPVADDTSSATIKNDRVTEVLSSTFLPEKLLKTSVVSDPTVATVVVSSSVATTMTSKDLMTTVSNVPVIHKSDIYEARISSTSRSDASTIQAVMSEIEAAKTTVDIHLQFEAAVVPDTFRSTPKTEVATSEIATTSNIFTGLPSKDSTMLTTEVATALKPNANMSRRLSIDTGLTSEDTTALITKVSMTQTSVANTALKSEFQTARASELAALTSDAETLTSKLDTTSALKLTTAFSKLTSKVDSTLAFNDTSPVHLLNAGSIQNDTSIYGIMTQHEMSSNVPVITSTVLDPTSVEAELGSTSQASVSSVSTSRTVETHSTPKSVLLSSRLSTGSTESLNLSTKLSKKDPSTTVIPTTGRITDFVTTSTTKRRTPSALAIQKSTASETSSSFSHTFSAKVNGQHDLSSLSTTSKIKNFQTSVPDFNSTVNGTGIVDSYHGTNVALAISLSLVFGLLFILAVSALIYCLLRNYCHQFHHCCSKHPGRCKFCSYSCVENRHYRGLQQHLTETPDLISESVHAQITRIARGSSHPDEIALLERSIDDQHSLNELDQLVFEDPDLVSPTSELFVDCRLASASSAYNYHSPENESSDDQNDWNSPTASRARNNLTGACFDFSDAGLYARAREPLAEASVYGRCQASSPENPYLKPSCHAHVEPGPNWRPFHPYDPVYVPHHDPVGMQRRLEGAYVTSPRLRMKQRNLYEEVRVDADVRRLVPMPPPMVPSRGNATDRIIAPVAPVRVSSRSSPVVHNRRVSHGSDTPITPVRVSSRLSPVVHSHCAVVDKSVSAGIPKPPARVSSRSSPVAHNGRAAVDHARPSTPVTSLRTASRSPPATSNKVLLPSSINTPSKGSSRATGESSLLDRSLPQLPVNESSSEPSVTCFPSGQRDSTSSSVTIPGHEYSRVDFGHAQQGPAPIVTTAEVEPYETDSDSCRDGAYESIDFPKNPP